MDNGFRSRLTTGFAVVSVGALVMTPVMSGQAPTPSDPPSVVLTASAQPLPAPFVFGQPTTLASLPATLAPIQPRSTSLSNSSSSRIWRRCPSLRFGNSPHRFLRV